MKPAVRVAVSGAAGQISYALLFRIASGEVFGPEQPIRLRLLEVTPALEKLRAVVMELEDCAYPLLEEILPTDQAAAAFQDADYVFLVGARPRGPGMERADLLAANAPIFIAHGQALNAHASRDVKVLVVGNPVNTNTYLTCQAAPELSARNFSGMMRLDHNRALSYLAAKLEVNIKAIQRLAVWGNHSASQYPDLHHALVNGRPAIELVSQDWFAQQFIPALQQRGAAVIQARGSSSAASAACAAVQHMRDWVQGTGDDWVSMALPSDGSYGIPEGIVYGFPARCAQGEYHIVQDLPINAFSQDRMQRSLRQLQRELEAV